MSPVRMSPPVGSLSGARSPFMPPEDQRIKLEAFRKIKPTCVTLLSLAAQAPSLTSPHVSLLDTLHRLLVTLPHSAFTPSMINYILFPITQILRNSPPSLLPDSFLEAAFRVLALVTRRWRDCPGGMDPSAWEQLWRFTAACIGPVGKGKGREVGQEARIQAIDLLAALLEPTPGHPTTVMLDKLATERSPLMPTLFQTITAVLETVSSVPSHLQLQLASLRLLLNLVGYLQGKHNVLASVLPGMISTLAKMIHATGKNMKGDVAAEACELVATIVTLTLNDTDLRRLGVLREVVTDLSQLADEWESTHDGQLPPNEPPPPSPSPSNTSTSSRLDPFPPLTSSYLAFTSTQLLSAIPPIIQSLVTHPSPVARQAVISLAYGIVTECREALDDLIPTCLAALLLLSRDDFDVVRLDARQKSRQLLAKSELELVVTLNGLLSDAINALPRLITSHQEARVDETARLVTAIAELTVELPDSERNAIADLLGPTGQVERWGWALLGCLEFGRPAGWSAATNTAARAAEMGWEERRLPTSSSAMLIDSDNRPSPENVFPHLPLKYVESEATLRTIAEMLQVLGSAGSETALHSVEHFMLFAKANRRREPARCASAVWLSRQLLDGVATAQIAGVEGKVGKATRKMAREVTKIVVAMDEDEDDDMDDSPREQETSDALLPVEHAKGVNALTTILDRNPLPNSHAAAETRRLHAQAQKSLLTAQSLATLCTTSKILSSSFRPLLLTSLYTILSHLTSPHHLISEFAEITLSQVSYNAGYASPRNLILDNVDYVINVVSQRLTYNRLSSSAPLVLIAMIRLVGDEIVPLVHDVVDEIFDALDDYHGYEALASSLLAVLSTLIEVMAHEVESAELSEERLQRLREMDRVDKPPDPEKDFGRFVDWFQGREQRRKEEMQTILDRAPQGPFKKEEAPDQDPPPEEPEPQPTRSQEVCRAILERSTNFLTHRSPFLRARILSLIAHATPVLASGNREGDLLPIIDKAWGVILNRLDDEHAYVVTEAAQVIASLCEHVGDYMSRRVLDHVWPRFKRLLEKQKLTDAKSALARRGALGTDSAHTTSHRLYVAILRTARFMAQEVPVNDGVVWEMMLLLRPFVDKRTHEELQRRAMTVYECLGRRDGDALWVVLRGTLGKLGAPEEAIWGWLGMDGLHV
ncbi:armadillo-type protein, partial [Naematelia encephala]